MSCDVVKAFRHKDKLVCIRVDDDAQDPRETWDQLRVIDLAYPIDRITVVSPDEPLLPAVQKVDGGDVRDGLVVAADGTVVGTIGASALYHALDRRRLRIAEEQAASKPPPPPPPALPSHRR